MSKLESYTFECALCRRTEVRPTNRLPEGWLIAENERAHCEDCAGPPRVIGVIPPAEELEFDGSTIAGFDAATGPDITVLTVTHDRMGDFGSYSIASRVDEPDPAFGYHLRREPGGAFKVQVMPWRVMTIWHPMLAFVLDPDEADKVADELKRYAALARNPGTMGAAA